MLHICSKHVDSGAGTRVRHTFEAILPWRFLFILEQYHVGRRSICLLSPFLDSGVGWKLQRQLADSFSVFFSVEISELSTVEHRIFQRIIQSVVDAGRLSVKLMKKAS